MPKRILTHYKFKRQPNGALGELAIGTALAGIRIPHCTIELGALDYVHPKTQAWIRDVILPRLDRGANLVIVISSPAPAREESIL